MAKVAKKDDVAVEAAPRSFEAVIAELEAIVARLERGDQPLEAALADFEVGVRLSREAGAVLEKAELRLARLTADDGLAEEPLGVEIAGA